MNICTFKLQSYKLQKEQMGGARKQKLHSRGSVYQMTLILPQGKPA